VGNGAMSGHCDNDDGPYGVVAFKDGPLTFPKWMKRVDAFVDQITGKIGFTSEDFADWGFADAFEDGVEPRQAAIDMLAEDVTGHEFLKTNNLLGEVSL
jgi:hypothetical protein